MSDKPASPARGRKKSAPPAQQPPQEEVVVHLPLVDLHPFPDHPFQVRDDEEMRETIQSVKEYGVIVPAIVRPREEGGYEIVAGHRRKHACEQAGLDTMPVLIRNMDRDAATIIMVDSNLQRENILPSERAKAYVTHSGEGEGLLFYGNVILPFLDRFPKDTELYRIMTTKPQEVSA